MKSKFKQTLIFLGFLVLILIIASIINDVFFMTFKEKSNSFLFYILRVIIIYLFIILILKYSNFGKEINDVMNKFFRKRFKKLRW